MIKILASHSVFKNLNKTELNYLKSIIKREKIKEGELLFDADRQPQKMYYIEKGQFTLALPNNEFKTLAPGQLIGEIGVINEDFRSGTVYANELSTVISICGQTLFDEKIIPANIALKILRSLSKRITSYLRLKEQISTREILEIGENDQVEFKSTLRWNLYSNKKDKAIEKASLKTMVAFMNTNGGVLIIGVNDEGEPIGLDTDQFENKDKMLLHLTNLIKKRIGTLYLKYLHFTIKEIGGKDTLRIDCHPASKPAYLKEDDNDHFYIRSGPSTTDLRLSKVYEYIVDRFYKTKK